MLAYGGSIPNSIFCIVITSRNVPIFTPIEIRRPATGIAQTCRLGPSYNLSFYKNPPPFSLLQLEQGKRLQLVNN